MAIKFFGTKEISFIVPRSHNVKHFDPKHPRDEVTLEGRDCVSLDQAFHEATILYEESVLGGDIHIVPLFWTFARDSTACFICKKSIASAKKDKFLVCDDCGNPFHTKCLNNYELPLKDWYVTHFLHCLFVTSCAGTVSSAKNGMHIASKFWINFNRQRLQAGSRLLKAAYC